MERIIRVTGKGSLSLAPDTIELIIHLEGKDKSYEKVTELSAKTTQNLRSSIEEAGFDGKELKTVSFNIGIEYESYQDENHCYSSRFAGYNFRHEVKLRFPAENKLLGKAIGAVASCGANPRFEINYTVKDRENAKAALLTKAVEDSKAKAKLIASAAGVELGDIASIDYSWEEINIISRLARMEGVPLMEKAAVNIDLEPEDIDISDTVTVIWNIA